MELVITEKSEVADELVKAISKNYEKKHGYYECSDMDVKITWASGNMLELCDPEYFDKKMAKWDRDQLPMSWPVKFIPKPQTSKQLKIIGDLLKQASVCTGATDIDKAGEFIFHSIIEHYGVNIPLKRILINDNNLLNRAWEKKQDASLTYNLSLSEKARTISDQLFGYNLTRALTTQAQYQNWFHTLTAGRVQSAILGIIVARQLAIENFKPSEYYNITADIQVENNILKKIKYVPNEDDPVDESNRIINESFATDIINELADNKLTLDKIDTKQKEVVRPLPYDLSSLQSDCDRLFKYSLDKVLKTTQTLREKRMITYNRTDSRYLNDESFYDAPNVLDALANIEMFEPIVNICEVDEQNKSRCFSSKHVTAHHGMIPTSNPVSVSQLSEEEFNVYYLICRNYMIQFMPPQLKESITLEFSTEIDERSVSFKASKSRQITAGWQILFDIEPKNEDDSEDEEESFDFDVEALEPGESYAIVMANAVPAATTPPAYYTIPSLLNAVRNTANLVTDPKIKQLLLDKDKGSKDRGGIGTAATRTPIITDMFKKKALKKIGNKIKTTEASMVLFNALPVSVTSPETTAIWASKQAEIEDGNLSVEQFVDDVREFVFTAVEEIKKGINIPEKLIQPKIIKACPCCSNESAEQRKGKHGIYWFCSVCNKNLIDYDGAPFDNESSKRESADCPKCKGEVEKHFGRFGVYWKCSICGNFPDLNELPFYEACPDCEGALKIIKPKAKNKSPFISCTNYPDCKYKRAII